eukprot:1352789-Karenia_brevis.AAC.1
MKPGFCGMGPGWKRKELGRFATRLRARMTRVRATRPCGMKPGSCGMELNRKDENEAEGACDPAPYQKCP